MRNWIAALAFLMVTLAACGASQNNASSVSTVAPTVPPGPTSTPTARPTPQFDVNEWAVFTRQSGNYLESANLGTGQVFSLYGSESVNQFLITPDGTSVVFLTDTGVWKSPIFGGETQKLAEVSQSSNPNLVYVNQTHALVLTDSLYSVPLDGSEMVRLGPGETSLDAGANSYEIIIAISPDGTQVAYLARSARAGNSQLYLSPIAGGTATPLAEAQPDSRTDAPRYVQFSPDGEYLIFSNFVGGYDEPNVTYVVPVAGGTPIELGPSVGPVYVTSSGRIILLRRGGLYSYSIEGGDEVKLITTPNGEFYYGVTPSGEHVLFRGSVVFEGSIGLWSVPITGGEPIQLVQEEYGDELNSFRVSLDGQTLAYVYSRLTLYTVPIGGGAATEVVKSTRDEYGVRIPSYGFSPDSHHLFAFVAENDGYNFYNFDLTGDSRVKLNEIPGSFQESNTSANAFEFYVSGDGSKVFYFLDEDEIGRYDFYMAPAAGGSQTKIYTADRHTTGRLAFYPSVMRLTGSQ